MGVPWVLYDHNDDERINLKGHGVLVSSFLEIANLVSVDVQDYLRRARNILRNVGYQATGEPSGVHGVFHK
jgi:glycosylphosphatidylinositol transamidase